MKQACFFFLLLASPSHTDTHIIFLVLSERFNISHHGQPPASPAASLTDVSLGLDAAHILSALVGWSLVSRATRAPASVSLDPGQWEDHDMTPAWNPGTHTAVVSDRETQSRQQAATGIKLEIKLLSIWKRQTDSLQWLLLWYKS